MITLKTTDPCVLSTDPWPNYPNLPDQTYFDAAWLAAQPTVVQKALASGPLTADEAVTLANQGYVIDEVTMVWGWDPMKTMFLRLSAGEPWTPNCQQPQVSFAPLFDGIPEYIPNSPLVGSISNSLNLADWPPFTLPPPPTPPPTDLVGSAIGASLTFQGVAYPMYYATSGTDSSAVPANTLNAYTDPQGRGQFTKVVTPSMFSSTGVTSWILTTPSGK